MEQSLRLAEAALRRFIEDAIQSEDGLSKEDEKYIAAEQKRIRQMKSTLRAA